MLRDSSPPKHPAQIIRIEGHAEIDPEFQRNIAIGFAQNIIFNHYGQRVGPVRGIPEAALHGLEILEIEYIGPHL